MAIRSPIQPSQENSTLALAVEPTTIRVSLLEPVAGAQRLIAWITVQRDLHAALNGQIAAACQRMGARIDRTLWDDAAYRPAVRGTNDAHMPRLTNLTAAVNPRPRLRVWLAGLSAHISMAAARQAISATPSQIVGETVLSATATAQTVAADLMRAEAELLVIVGGHDDEGPRAQRTVLTLCQRIGQALEQLPAGQAPRVVYAGNRWAAAQVQPLLNQESESQRLEVVNNVVPTARSTNLTDLARAVQHERWRLACQTPGIAAVGQWVTEPAHLTALDWSFAQMVQVWMEQQGLPELHAVYRTADWHQHVWTRRGHDVVRMVYLRPGGQTSVPDGWPVVQLLSGALDAEEAPPPLLRWWDRSGMAPLIATMGQIAPAAMLQVLQRDLFSV